MAEKKPDAIETDSEFQADEQKDARYELRLYVAGKSEKSLKAFSNLKKFCEEYLQGKYRIEVIDLFERPQLARDEQIVAIPTLVRRLPEPLRKIIGDLSDTEKVLVGLDIKPASWDDDA